MISREYPTRVALVNPPHATQFNPEFESGVPPLGLGAIAAFLRECGYHCDVFDLADQWPFFPEALTSSGLYEYDVYGITSYTKNFFAAEALAKELKVRAGDPWIVMGGPHASAVPTLVLRQVPEIDFVIANEGEEPLRRLLQELACEQPNFHSVPNLTYRVDQSIEFSTAKFEYQDLNNYPAPARDIRLARNLPVLKTVRSGRTVQIQFLSSSRGCPKSCTFCSIIVMSPKYRYRSVESIMAELRVLRKTNSFSHVAFVDANFFAHWKRAVEFSEALYAYDPRMTWSGTATVDQICRQPEAVCRIGDLNCVELEVGIENGSDAVLKRFNKQTTVEQNLACFEILRAARIRIELDFILFDPIISTAELAENLNFFKSAGLTTYAPAHFLYTAAKMYPGTSIRAEYQARRPLREDFFGVPPFLSSSTQLIYDLQIDFAQTYMARIERAIERLEQILDSVVLNFKRLPPGRGLLISKLLIRLRQAPFEYFSTLVESDYGTVSHSKVDEQLSHDAAIRMDRLLEEVEAVCVISENTVLKPETGDYPMFEKFNRHETNLLLSDVSRPIVLDAAGEEFATAFLRSCNVDSKSPIQISLEAATSLMRALGMQGDFAPSA